MWLTSEECERDKRKLILIKFFLQYFSASQRFFTSARVCVCVCVFANIIRNTFVQIQKQWINYPLVFFGANARPSTKQKEKENVVQQVFSHSCEKKEKNLRNFLYTTIFTQQQRLPPPPAYARTCCLSADLGQGNFRHWVFIFSPRQLLQQQQQQ